MGPIMLFQFVFPLLRGTGVVAGLQLNVPHKFSLVRRGTLALTVWGVEHASRRVLHRPP